MERKKSKKELPRKRVSVIRTMAVREKTVLYEGRRIRNAEDAVRLMKPFMEDADREHLLVCCLDRKNQPVSIEVAAVGTVSKCLVGMREVFKNAVLSNAASLILFHNHPSGDATPSMEDIAISKKLKQAGELLDTQVLDHIILGQDDFHSMAETLGWRTWQEETDIVA